MTISDIIEAVAEVTGVEADEILGRGREMRIIKARQLAIWIARNHTSRSLLEIANAFGKKHATILTGIKFAEKMLELDAEYARERDAVVARLAKVDCGCSCAERGCVWFTECYADVIEYNSFEQRPCAAETMFAYWRENCVDLVEAMDDFAFFYVKKGEEKTGAVWCFGRNGVTVTFPDEEMSETDMEKMSTGEEVDGYTRIPAAEAVSRVTFRLGRC